PPGVVAARPHRAELPPLLQHLGADRGAGGGPRGVRGHPRQDPPAAGGGCARRAADRPSRRARGPRRLPGAPDRGERRALGGVAEKGRWGGERLPGGWPVAGTTGCDALRQVDGLFTDSDGAYELVGRYRAFAAPQTDRGGNWDATVRRAAYKVLSHDLAAETG